MQTGLRSPSSDRRGSLLIVAMLLAAIIGISLVSYIKLAMNSATLADRSFYQNSAINLAEMGVEEALYCYNRLDENSSNPSGAWTGTSITWTIHGTDNSVTATLPSITIGNGVTGSVKVYCSHYNPSGTNPVVIARSLITMPNNGPTIEKWLEITLRKRSLWANGMVARNTITWNGGNSSADSWNSDPDNDTATAAVGYGTTDGPAKANATLGTPSTVNGAIDLSGGTVRGRIMDAGGTISHTSAAILSNNVSGTGWDSTLVSSDFSASFPGISVPAPPSGGKNTINSSRPVSFPSTLPATGDVAWNGVYYYEFASGYGAASSGSSTNVLTINGPVVFLATGNNGVNTIDLGGSASIAIAANASLTVYTNGNIEAAGNGISNSNSSASTFQIYGTSTTAGAQTIRFVGNGASTAAIYAPNATFQLKGNGSLNGAVIANEINLNGNAAFHYDEALGNTTAGNPFGVIKWRELQSASERTTANTTSHTESVAQNWLKP
jgi:hypothetical protein